MQESSRTQKIVIYALVLAEVLTLFPTLFWMIYLNINAESNKSFEMSKIWGTLGFGVLYSASVLLGSYQAIQNLKRPKLAYLIVAIPFLVLILGYLFYLT